MARLPASHPFPARDCRIDIKRVDLDAVAEAARALRGNDRRPAATKGIDNDVGLLCNVEQSQRIHEDARHLVDTSTDIGIGLLQSTLLLICFITVLWTVSQDITFSIDGWSFALPGYMVWLALTYAGIASLVSWRVGRPLIALNAERYAREADLRTALVRVNDRTDAIAFYRGEEDEKRRLHQELEPILATMRRLVTGFTRLTWVTAGYGWFAIVAPIVVAAPGFFTGDLTLGGLMMVVGAFNQVQQALRW